MNIKNKAVDFNTNIKKHGLPFNYNIRAHPFLGIGYVAVRQIPFICSKCSMKLDSPWSISQNNYNQHQYKGEN